MIEVVAIGGAPGTGKSTLMRRILDLLGGIGRQGKAEQLTLKLLRGYTFKVPQIMVLGIYGSEVTFPGTDRLSMAVQPECLQWLEHMNRSREWHGWRVFFEGDRLCNSKFFKECQRLKIPFRLILLECSNDEQQRRFRERGSQQPENFIKGRATKYLNLARSFPHTVLSNELPSHSETWAAMILSGVIASD